jgi:hypothetical protein
VENVFKKSKYKDKSDYSDVKHDTDEDASKE